MKKMYTITANFIYLDFNACIARKVLTDLNEVTLHKKVLQELLDIISEYLNNFIIYELQEMTFLDNEGMRNGYFKRRLVKHKSSEREGKLELIVKKD